MKHQFSLLLVVALGLAITAAQSQATRTSYRAASVIHFPVNMSSPNNMSIAEIIQSNLNVYDQHVSVAAQNGSELIVFPESGTGYLMAPVADVQQWCEPMPSVGWRADIASCGGSGSGDLSSVPSLHAQWASCAAQKYQIDIVFNFGFHDVLDGHFYNANAAFNRDGYLLAIYRKSHINAVPLLTQPPKPDPVTFVSSFGVTFGMFVCYDMWFQQPMYTEMQRLNVTDFVYPNGMASLGPLMVIDQVHAGWSLVHGVNLVSAGLFPTGGAGVFHLGNVLAVNPQQPYAEVAYSVVIADVPLITTAPVAQLQPSSSGRSFPLNRPVGGVSSSTLCFNGTGSCTVFVPSANTTHSLSASYQGRFANISCFAEITTMSSSNHTWMLVAAQLNMVPSSPSTPDDNEAAFCAVMHCGSMTQGCAFGAPVPSYWTSDLHVSHVVVSATVGGGMQNATNVNFYPLYGYLNMSEATSSFPFPLSFPTTDAVTAQYLGSSPLPNYLVEVRGFEDHELYSVGAYFAAKGPSWTPPQ